MYWEIGRYINEDILENKRADYGKKIVARVATQLTEKYGSSFASRNLRRMMQLAEQFTDFEIVSKASTQLSWSHFIDIGQPYHPKLNLSKKTKPYLLKLVSVCCSGIF